MHVPKAHGRLYRIIETFKGSTPISTYMYAKDHDSEINWKIARVPLLFNIVRQDLLQRFDIERSDFWLIFEEKARKNARKRNKNLTY
jgi:hypothetical protein